MKVNTGPELKFDEMTDIEKKLFLHSYFAIKSHMISQNFAQIRSSRDKDEECYRWRYADNEMLFYETDLIKHRLDAMNNSQKTEKPEGKEAEFYNSLVQSYQKHISDIDRIKSERATFSNWGIDLSDLQIDFVAARKLYMQMPEPYQNMVESSYYGNGWLYGIYDMQQIISNENGSQFGK